MFWEKGGLFKSHISAALRRTRPQKACALRYQNAKMVRPDFVYAAGYRCQLGPFAGLQVRVLHHWRTRTAGFARPAGRSQGGTNRQFEGPTPRDRSGREYPNQRGRRRLGGLHPRHRNAGDLCAHGEVALNRFPPASETSDRTKPRRQGAGLEETIPPSLLRLRLKEREWGSRLGAFHRGGTQSPHALMLSPSRESARWQYTQAGRARKR